MLPSRWVLKHIYMTVAGKEDNVVARVDPRTATRTGHDTLCVMDTTRLHFFDKDTENTILNR